jgi:nucleoside-diphosphate-sugar epimerase
VEGCWDGVRVLVTGAGGFIGGHLTVGLNRAGAEVRAFCRYTSRGDRGTLDWFQPGELDGVEVVLGDLRDPESVLAAVRGVDVVMHLGAQIAIPYSFINPRDFFETNLGGTLNVAQAALTAGVRRLMHVSTSEVYGRAASFPIRVEHQHPAPRSPYAASKVAADALIDSYRLSFDLPVTVVRPFNTYGPHQSARAIVPTIAIQLLAGDRLRLGRLDTRRDLTFVADTIDGMIAAASTDRAVGQTVQLGSGVDASVGELVELIAEITGSAPEVEADAERIRPGESEIERLVCDTDSAAELIGWHAKTDLRSGLRQTVKWLEANQKRYRSEVYAR